ncbi:MAG TPA: patatin-like phospholipase family protein [Pseudonocardia sp.]|jgi:NTE family protein|nr:patatin-like phospholipase family protein [Pseudonocardia sp.]
MWSDDPVTRGEALTADLVLSGGGVKGVALAGAVAALNAAGYRPWRVSGTSAGAIVGALVAAGLVGDDLTTTAMRMDFKKFADRVPLDRIPLIGAGLALTLGDGVYQGDYARDWVSDELAKLGVHTFGDLALDDPQLPPEKRYKLVVTCADITLGRLIRLPWDYREVYGLDPDEQSVAEAVRASMSIPLLYRPVTLTNPATEVTSTLVDGGVVSNFPIDSLDRTDGLPPRWPTFGVTLLPDIPGPDGTLLPRWLNRLMPAPVHLLEGVITTALVGRDQAYENKPWVRARTIQVDSDHVGFADFNLTDDDVRVLYDDGHHAAETFLSTWDWEDYLRRFRILPSNSEVAP